MAVPIDPFPDFVNGVDVADGDKVDARFKALFDALDVAQSGLDTDSLRDLIVTTAKLAAGAVTTAKIADGTILPADVNGGLLQKFGGGSYKFNTGTASLTYFDNEQLVATTPHGLGPGVTPIAAGAVLQNPFAPAAVRSVICGGTNIVIGANAIPMNTFTGFAPGNIINAAFWVLG